MVSRKKTFRSYLAFVALCSVGLTVNGAVSVDRQIQHSNSQLATPVHRSVQSAVTAVSSLPVREVSLDCTFELDPTSRSFSHTGGGGTVDVTASCPWTAVANDFWVIITSGASGTEDGTVGFVVLPNPDTTSRQMTLTIAGLPFLINQSGVPPLAITTTSLSFGIEDAQYVGPLGASGGTPPYQWSITAGTLPGGLELGAETGVIAGHPSTVGTYPFTARVTDTGGRTSERALAVTVYGAELQLVTNTLPAAVRTRFYSTQVFAAGGFAPYSYVISSGGLPVGLELDPGTGAITGTSALKGTFRFTITATDGRLATATNLMQLVVIDPEEAPRIGSMKFKRSGKLIVNGRNFDPLSAVMIDGVIQRTIFGDSTSVVVKGLDLGTGDHEVRIVASNGVVSEAATLRL